MSQEVAKDVVVFATTHADPRSVLRGLPDAQRILHTARDAFVAMSSDGVITGWNGAAEEMFGYSLAEALGQQMSTLILPDRARAEHDAAHHRFSDARAAPDASEEKPAAKPHDLGDYKARHSSGRAFPVEVTHWWMESRGEIMFYAFIRDISESKTREQELALRRAREAGLVYRTTHDELTGLANRTLVLERISQALARRARDGGDVAVLFVDLDRFKLINDNLGHDAGDELLCVVAERLTSSVRAADSVARVAGDEFVVMCDELDGTDEAQVVAHRILDSLQEPVDLAGERVRVRGSIGIAFAQCDTDTADDLLRDSDAAMYRAKELGRAQVAVFDDSMRQRLRNQLHMEREIAECLDRDELRLWYRPIFDLRLGIVTGMHPRIVWQHPRRGLLGPVDFTPIAEEVGVMPAILDWAVHEICGQARAWRSAGSPDLFMGFDLSARQASYPSFAPELAAALRSSELDGSALTICVLPPGGIAPTEDKVLLRELDALRSLGVVVGVNGSGAESSVLSWLADIPFDTFKIAPYFGSAIGAQSRADRMVSSLVTMSHDMGMTVSIDGISTPAQGDRAAELGCDFAQGALFGDMALPPSVPPSVPTFAPPSLLPASLTRA